MSSIFLVRTKCIIKAGIAIIKPKIVVLSARAIPEIKFEG